VMLHLLCGVTTDAPGDQVNHPAARARSLYVRRIRQRAARALVAGALADARRTPMAETSKEDSLSPKIAAIAWAAQERLLLGVVEQEQAEREDRHGARSRAGRFRVVHRRRNGARAQNREGGMKA
jgi:hypothetical protein